MSGEIFADLINVASILINLVARFDLEASLLIQPIVGVLLQNKAMYFPSKCKKVIATSSPATRATASPSDIDVSLSHFIVLMIDCFMSPGNGILNTSGECVPCAQ